MTTLGRLSFDNHFARLGSGFSSAMPPMTMSDPYQVSVNPEVAALIDLDPAELHTAEFLRFVSGNRLPPGSDPVAMVYAGHRFGTYVPQVDDTPPILVGQVRNTAGESWDLQLKVSVGTPSSASTDGLAVLRSAIREYLCSEAMHHLGIPTTRALAVAAGTTAADHDRAGDAGTAAALLRVAPSHIRFGSFELFYYRQHHDAVRTLADYVTLHQFPEVAAEPGSLESHFEFLRAVVVRTARLVAHWQAVGFAHGALDTDRMSILGIGFDYGPFGFVESYDPDFVGNPSDEAGRYALSNQAPIAFWNLCALAQALSPLIPGERRQEALEAYEPEYAETLSRLMRGKLGLIDPRDEDETLINGLLEILRGNEVDYTQFFRALSDRGGEGSPTGPADPAISALFKYPEAFAYWNVGYRARIAAEGIETGARRRQMRLANPRFVLRDRLIDRAVELAGRKDFSELDRLMDILRKPYDDQPGMDEYAGPRPEKAPSPRVSGGRRRSSTS